MAVTDVVGGIVYYDVGPGGEPPTAFWYNGSRYFAGRNGVWFREWINPRGLTSHEIVTVRFVKGIGPLGIPTTIRSRPIPIWPKPSGGSVFSFHVDAMRWLRVLAYIDENGALEIPLLDVDGQPWFGMGIPPKVVIRRNSRINTDEIAAPEAAGVKWQDIGIGYRPGGPFNTANRTFGSTQQFHWTLKALLDPVPHWVMRIQSALITSNNRTYMIDLFSEGGGKHTTTTREVGTAGNVGHWKATLMWSQQDFMTSPDRTILNQRKHSVGSIDVPNDPEPGTTPATFYITTGANAGLATGTALFTVIPCVMVFGNATIGAYATNVETTWEPETWGMGSLGISTNAILNSGASRAYYSEVYKDAVSGHYAVDIHNIGALIAGGAPNAALDRTFFPMAVGK